MSQQDLNAFADWLVANQSKKGTPEYDTVAKAFSELDNQNQDTSLSTAYQFGDKMVQANSADYAADLNQRLDQGFLGNMTRLGQEYIGNPIRNALGFDDIQQDQANREFEAANRAKATQMRGEADALNYRSLTADDIDGVGSAINYGAQAVAESLPQMLPALANPTVGGALNMGIIMPGELNAELKAIEGLDDNTRMNLAASGGALMGALETLGVGVLFKGIPTEVLGKMGVKRIAAALEKKGMGRVANRFASGFAGEGVTELGQNEISMAFEGLGGKDISDEEASLRRRESFLKGGAAGGMIRGGGSAVAETASGIKNMSTSPEIADDPQAASELANDLRRVANVDGYDLQNVNTGATTGARAAVDTLHAEYSSQIEFEFNELESKLGITKEDPRYEAFQKVKANTAKRKGKNKVKSRVDPSDFAILRDLTQGTEEGANLLKLLRKSNELSFLANQGLKGGLSQYFDVLNPLDTDGRYNIGRTVAAPISTLGAYGTMGASVLPAVAGRAVDAMTGRRSRVARYVRENQGNPGIQVPTEPSLRDQDQEATANAERDALRVNNEERQTAEFLDSIDAPPAANPNNPSPQAQLEDATGFDKQTAIDVAAMIGNSNFYPEAIRRFATDYIASVRQGGTVGKKGEGGLSSLIRLMNRLADSDPDNYPRANPQNQLAIQAAGGGGPTIMTRAAMQREQGRADNQAFNDELQAAVNADTSIDRPTKALVLEGLRKARKTFAGDPVEAVEAIYLDVATRAKNPQYADQYIMPYVERVTAQQQQQAATEQPAATEAPSGEPEINRMAVPDFGEGLSIFPKTKALYSKIDGIDVDQGNYQAGPDDVTGNTYGGARVYIGDNGRGRLEVDPNQAASPDKADGKRWNSNLVRPNLYEWTSNPGNRQQSFIVTVEQGPKHFYALQYEADVPTELYRKPLKADGTKADEPTMRPRGFGNVVPGRQIGTVKLKSSGKEHPIYDTIRIEPSSVINQMSTVDIFANPPVLEGTGKKGIVTIEDVGRYLETKSIEAGSRSPRTIRGSKETNSIDYTPELKQRLFDDILEEAKEFYKTNPGAAYWYTFGSPEALDMMSKSIPELQEDGTNHPDRGLPLQMLFWTLISPLSGGQDPVANAKLAVDVLRYYIQNGTIPLSKYKGGLFINDDNVAAKEAEGEILAWTARGKTTSNALAAIQNGIDTFGSLEQFMLWMVTPHPQQEVVDQYQQLGFGSEEASKSLPKYADENGMLYGSQVLGPKFGPFLLNNTGNESKVTKDEWFTRSWNRLNGRMFTANGKEMLSQPSSPEERMVQDEIITKVAAEIGLEPAQVQALWWAYEQQLYTRMGVKSPTRDYVDAAKEVIKKVAGEAAAIDAEREARTRLSGYVAEKENEQQGILRQDELDFGPSDNGRSRAEPGAMDVTPLAGSREPTPTEVQEVSRPVKAIFEIGKKGSPYENGIRDYDTVQKLAQALNHTFHLVTSTTAMAKAVNIPYRKAKGSMGLRVTLGSNPDTLKGRLGVVKSKNKIYEMYVALHELGHALESSYVDEQARQEGTEILGRNFYSPGSQGVINDPQHSTYSNTFRAAIRELMALYGDQKVSTGDFTNQDARDIIDEIIQFQRTGVIEGFGTKSPIRKDYSRGAERVALGIMTQGEVDAALGSYERSYFQTPYEMAADLLGVYMLDPALAKREMPKASKLARLLLKDNPTIQFFSAPLSVVLSMVMANMLIAEREEEEKKMPPPGALSLGQAPGALSI